MTIRKLDESLVVRIAAGEVIERPASVVKELVENAFDAGATSVVVRLERGGLGLIEVADDGCGIAPGELGLAIQRHATSKITEEADLERIRTMGFRGEALAAIAAAGRLCITTKTSAGEAVRLDVSEEYSPDRPDRGLRVEPASRAVGTTVSVRDLFLRTPARLKFMKSATAELGRVSDMLERLALARPDVAVELVRDGRRVFRTEGRGNLRDCVRTIFGADVAAALVEVDAVTGTGRLSGLVSPPQLTRRNRTGFHYHLLGRPFEDRVVMHAITAAYEGLLPSGQFPIVFLGIAIDPAEADVNVHPAKAEVRFRDSAAIHRLVAHGLRAHLRSDLPLPEFSPQAAAPGSELAGGFGGERSSTSGPNAGYERPPIAISGARAAMAEFEAMREESSSPVLPMPEVAPRAMRLRYLGEVAGRYLVAEDDGGLVLVDQHAAHERVLFDRLRAAAAAGTPAVQPLLAPIVVELPASERLLAEDRLADFTALGFELEAWPDSLALRAIPSHFRGVGDAARLLRETLARLHASESDGPRLAVSYERLARAACKAAVKGTERLSDADARRLLDDLKTTTDPYTCPHGRPTMVRLTLAELDRRFGRLGM